MNHCIDNLLPLPPLLLLLPLIPLLLLLPLLLAPLLLPLIPSRHRTG